MKSPLEKLRKFALNKSEPKENWDHHISVHVDGLTQAAKDMKDMRICYDSLLSAAAAAANSAYEFSESLLEMGDCLMEKTAVHDDGDTGGALSLLGRLQLDLQKLVDSYRSHIIMTITNPSESLLSELRKVEEMKLQCDEKREMFDYMVGQMREKGKSRHGKGESFSSQQLQAVCEEYDEAARLCIFRVESLKQGQCRSLLTQAARHHAAQLDFFRKGLHSLEAVEPHIKSVAEKHRIDYALGELKDSEEGDEGNSFETNYEGELSFDYRRNNVELEDSYTSRNSMEVDQLGAAPDLQSPRIKDAGEQILSQQRRVSSHSAPIYAEKFDPAERIREMRTAVHKLNNNTHVLPTPADAKRSSLTSTTTAASSSSKNLWHSSPLDVEKQKKVLVDVVDHNTTTPGYSSKPQIAAVEENINNNNNDKHSHPLPRPLTEGGASVQQFDTQSGFDTWKIKRQAFSGPLASKPSVSNKPVVFHTSGPISLTTETHQSATISSGLLLSRVSASGNQQLLPPSSINVSQNSSSPPLPPLVSSPKISELHELPRPPPPVTFNKPMPSVMIDLGHSAPLVVNRNQQEVPTKRPFKGGSPLPLPQLTVSRSFSIPSSSQRAMAYHSGQLMHTTEQVASPPLTPMSLSNIKSPNSGHIRVDAGGR